MMAPRMIRAKSLPAMARVLSQSSKKTEARPRPSMPGSPHPGASLFASWIRMTPGIHQRSKKLCALRKTFPKQYSSIIDINRYRKSVLDRIGKIPVEQFQICADGYLAYLVPFLGPVIGLKGCFTYYRLHGKNSFANPFLRNNEFRQLRLRQYELVVESVNRDLQR